MKFKAKIRRIGNSLGVLIPFKVITSYKEGDEIELDVITKGNDVITKDTTTGNYEPDVITQKAVKFNVEKGIYE